MVTLRDIIDACAQQSELSYLCFVNTGPQHQSDEATGKCVPEKSHRFLLIFFFKDPQRT